MLDVCDKWVTHISMTPWKTTEQGQCQSSFSHISRPVLIVPSKVNQFWPMEQQMARLALLSLRSDSLGQRFHLNCSSLQNMR
jgi:hypothetical protein